MPVDARIFWFAGICAALSIGRMSQSSSFQEDFITCHYTKLGHEHDEADNHQQYVEEA